MRWSDEERPPTPCPYCGAPFTDGTVFRLHVEDQHGTRLRRSRMTHTSARRARLQRTVDGLRFLPLWFVLPLNLSLVAVVVMSFSSPWHPLWAISVRTAMLPSILLLAARVAGTKPML